MNFAGLIYTYSTGMRQHLYVNQPELVKEMNQCISLDLGKPSYVSKRLAPMLGNGILRSNGIVWSQQRKIVAPEFFTDKVKVKKEFKFKKKKKFEQLFVTIVESLDSRSANHFFNVKGDGGFNVGVGATINWKMGGVY